MTTRRMHPGTPHRTTTSVAERGGSTFASSATIATGATMAYAGEHEWDAVHDAALESFPASDAPSWSALRAGPPSDF